MRSRLTVDREAVGVVLAGRTASDRFDDLGLESLGDFEAAEEFRLYHQRITRVPRSLARLRRPFALHLADCPSLESLDGIEQLGALRKLSLALGDQLDLASSFARLAELPDLAELAIAGISDLPVAISMLSQLLGVSLLDSPRLDVGVALARIGQMTNLRSVTLAGFALLPDAFAPLAGIDTLVIRGAAGALPESIGSLARLRVLRVEAGRIDTLPRSIGQLAALAELRVCDNKLVALPDELYRCAALETLDVRGNPIRELSPKIGRLARLSELHIARTRITIVPTESPCRPS